LALTAQVLAPAGAFLVPQLEIAGSFVPFHDISWYTVNGIHNNAGWGSESYSQFQVMLGDGLIYGTISHSLSFLQADLSRPVRGLECTVFSAKLDAELILRSPRRQRDPAGDRPIKLPFRFVSFCRFGLLILLPGVQPHCDFLLAFYWGRRKSDRAGSLSCYGLDNSGSSCSAQVEPDQLSPRLASDVTSFEIWCLLIALTLCFDASLTTRHISNSQESVLPDFVVMAIGVIQ
jgi:hypothetical protein